VSHMYACIYLSIHLSYLLSELAIDRLRVKGQPIEYVRGFNVGKREARK